jgi:hypothetical protein
LTDWDVGGEGTWLALHQSLDDTFLRSEIRRFDDQVVCDRTPHTWRVLFDGRDGGSGEAFRQGRPLEVRAVVALVKEPDAPYTLDVSEELSSAPAEPRERLQLDVTDVSFTSGGAARVTAMVACPSGYAPLEDPAFVRHAASMVLDQSVVRVRDGAMSVVNRTTRRRDLVDQIVCDDTAHVLSIRFSFTDDLHRLRGHVPIRVTMTITVTQADSNVIAERQEEFRGLGG